MERLPRFHLGAVVVPDEMQNGVDERALPLFSNDLRAHHDVAELARQPVGQIVERVERERERVRRLVDLEMLELERAALLGADEHEPEVA